MCHQPCSHLKLRKHYDAQSTTSFNYLNFGLEPVRHHDLGICVNPVMQHCSAAVRASNNSKVPTSQIVQPALGSATASLPQVRWGHDFLFTKKKTAQVAYKNATKLVYFCCKYLKNKSLHNLLKDSGVELVIPSRAIRLQHDHAGSTTPG